MANKIEYKTNEFEWSHGCKPRFSPGGLWGIRIEIIPQEGNGQPVAETERVKTFYAHDKASFDKMVRMYVDAFCTRYGVRGITVPVTILP